MFVPILMYHEVTDRPLPAFRKYSVPARAFAAQMRWLALAGYTTITLDALLDARVGGTALPSRSVVITFDDGFEACARHAVPVLQRHHFTAIFYLVAGLMGQSSTWLLRERGIQLPLMDWSTARRLSQSGFQIGAHTMSHPHLAELPAGACAEELHESRRVLEAQLAQAVPHLAYPFGSFNADVRTAAIAAGYRSACSTQLGRSPHDDDPWTLRRVFVHGQDSLPDFAARVLTGFPIRDMLHGAAQRVRSRLRPTRVQAPQ